MNAVTAVAPGKLILTGEHAVVYQRPALVTAIDLWLRVTIAPRDEGVGLNLVELDHREATDGPTIRGYADTVRDRWRQYAEHPTPDAFARMQGTDPSHLVKVALGEAARYTEAEGLPSVDVTIRSEQPIGAGFGSSAAVAVAVARAYLAYQGDEIDGETLYELALDVERRQHGTPSGVDPATVLQGGLVWAERAEDCLQYQSVTARSPVLDGFRVFHTGRPEQSTGTVVDAVRDRRERDPEAFRKTLDRIEEATRTLRSVFSKPTARPDDALKATRRVEAGLEALGVVPDPIQRRIRAIEEQGGAAKISGAGALRGDKAGSLLVYHPDPDAPVGDTVDDLPELEVQLGAEGARIESNDE